MLSTWRDDEEDSRDCCQWRGITCNNQTGHVLKLDIHGDGDWPYGNYLTGEINITSLIELQNLEYLDLSSNEFRGSQIPNHMGSFTNLRFLNLSYSDFSGRIPYELGNLSQLQFVDLSINDIDGEIPYELGNLSQLQYLDLRETSLSGLIPFHFGSLPMLHTLKLAESNFTIDDEAAEWLSSLLSLKSLHLSKLGSSHQRLQTMSKLIPNLRELRLIDCGLLDVDISSLFHSNANFSTSLTILDLRFNMLTSSTLQFLSNFSLNLQELYLYKNNIIIASPLYYPNFPSLVKLDLSRNNLSSSIFEGNFKFSSKLQELHLGGCSLMDRSFPVSPALTMNSSSSLAVLDLSHNLLKSPVIFHWLSNFTTNLRSLDLDSNFIKGPVSLENSCTLQELHLNHNYLSGEIPNFIQNSTWCGIHKLQILDLSYNWITGMIHDLSIFPSLRILDLSNNKLTGEIPGSLGLLSKLEYLHLEENYMEGDIKESHFNNLFSLVALDFTDNYFSLKFDSNWVPPFQLTVLGLASCKLGPSFPNWLKTQSRLRFLDISDAGINDFVPDWFWSKLQSIERMNISHNGLIGTIPNLPIMLSTSAIYDMKSNQFEGGIPAFLAQAYVLDLSKNMISDMNTFLCGKSGNTSMTNLVLSNNQIAGHFNSLRFLDLSDNKLSGEIPQSIGTLVNLYALVLRNNNLVGELPTTLRDCTSLLALDVGENLLTGPIPKWIGKRLPQLNILSMGVNRFSGSIPPYLCYLQQIQVLDLSRNNLSKDIPACLQNFTAMNESGTIFSEFGRGRKISSKDTIYDIYSSDVLLMWKRAERVYTDPEILRSIDFSGNNLTGKIPKEVGYLLGLVSLNLSRNNLSGEIPLEIGNLTSLEFLDLSRNQLQDKIPSSLSQIDRLSMLDLSHNLLSGRIPSGTQLRGFDNSSFEGNLDLCGEPLSRICGTYETKVKPQGVADDDGDNSAFYQALYMSLSIGFFTGFWGLLGPILIWRPWRISYLRFLNRFIDYVYVMVAVNVAKLHRWLKC